MLYTGYAAWLATQYAGIPIDPSWTEIGPLHRATKLPASPPWNMDWAVLFPDDYYVYVYERWYPSGPSIPGRAKRGYREHFSFHYGPTNHRRKPNGIPERDKVACPAIIRIDCDRRGPHLHFHGEADHIDQSRVAGMVINDADPFDFVRAVIEHRETGIDFDAILKFRVTP